ncbi:hypothetical protein PQX77_015573 [Marasmius sp. AFHP31]|nr:hypothetical protein PQX77_015573 [Marasmius sp. AFHP31]
MQGHDSGSHSSDHGAYRQANYRRDHNVNNGPGPFVVNNAGRDFVNHYNTIIQNNPRGNIWGILSGIGASHKAERQFERGQCLPGTRTKALNEIYEWWSMRQQDHPICWLSGAAGVGKSAIAMTIAQACEAEKSLVSSFFFFRSDSKRNNPSALWLSIAHDLTLAIPAMRKVIEERISNDPTVLEARLEDQFRDLILKPATERSWLRSLWEFLSNLAGVPPAPTVIIIDGLDECGDEKTQLRILSIIQSAYQQVPHFPLQFLICSRPESWIWKAFAKEPLSHLSERISLDDSIAAREDIMQYCRHHFHEITTGKYSDVPFPCPWPSERDLELLVAWSCGQFIYIVTVIKFITLADNHPIAQLEIVLNSSLDTAPANSPYPDLDCLYNIILESNPNHTQLLRILAVIVILPDCEINPTPILIEHILGLRSGQVALTLRGMHSVLEIHDQDKKINLYHTSFRDYLVDQTRSGHFYINIPAQKHIIAQHWLRNLTTNKVLTYRYEVIHIPLSLMNTKSLATCVYRSDQLYSGSTWSFFWRWTDFCISMSEPTHDLLDDLQNVDLTSTYWGYCYRGTLLHWEDVFKEMAKWVKKYHDPKNNENKDKQGAGDHAQASENMHLKHNGHLPYGNSQHGVNAHSCEPDKERDGSGLVEAFVHKLENLPRYFHLKSPPGVFPQEDILYWLVCMFTQCPYTLDGDRTLEIKWFFLPGNIYLTDCHCDPLRGDILCDPGHLTYQDACLQVLKLHISRFEEFAQKSTKDEDTLNDLECILEKIVCSFLLESCRLDAELLLLCHMFFGLAKGCAKMCFGPTDGKKGRENMLEWIKNFPDCFAEEGEALRVQILALPWQQWEENFESWERNIRNQLW